VRSQYHFGHVPWGVLTFGFPLIEAAGVEAAVSVAWRFGVSVR
jgi:hypothetical protein